jgi:hypothetical protein
VVPHSELTIVTAALAVAYELVLSEEVLLVIGSSREATMLTDEKLLKRERD